MADRQTNPAPPRVSVRPDSLSATELAEAIVYETRRNVSFRYGPGLAPED